MRPHFLRIDSPVRPAHAGAGLMSAMTPDEAQTVRQIMALDARARSSEKTQDLDAEALRHKQAFDDISATLRDKLKSIDTRLVQAEARLTVAQKSEQRTVRTLHAQRKRALDKRARLDETLARLTERQESAEARLLALTAERNRQSTALGEAVAARDNACAPHALLDDACTLDRLQRQGRHAFSQRTADELTSLMRRHVGAWQRERPDLAHIAARLVSPESVQSIRHCLENHCLTHALLLDSPPEASILAQQTHLALTDSLAREIPSAHSPIPTLGGALLTLVMMVDAACCWHQRWHREPDPDTLVRLLDTSRVAEALAHAVGAAQAARPALVRSEIPLRALDKTASLMRAFYTQRPTGRALMRWTLDTLTAQTDLMRAFRHGASLVPFPAHDAFPEQHAAYQLSESLRQSLLGTDNFESARAVFDATESRANQMVMVTLLLVMLAGMFMLFLKPALAALRVRSASRAAHGTLAPLAESILADYQRIPAVANFSTQGPPAKAVIQRHGWAPEAAPLAGETLPEHFFNQLRNLQDSLRAHYAAHLKPHDRAIVDIKHALASTDTRLAACNDTLEKLRLSLPQKTRERQDLQAAILALEQQIEAQAVEPGTLDDLHQARQLSQEADLVMQMLAQEKEAYLDRLAQLRSRYHTRLAALNAERSQQRALESTPAYLDVRKKAQQLITPAAWRRALARHQGLAAEALKSRIDHGRFENAQGDTVTTAPVGRASSYHHEAHLLRAIFDAAAQAAELRQPAPGAEQTLRIAHDQEVGLAVQRLHDDIVETPATTSRVTFVWSPEGAPRITHIHPDT